MSVGKDVDRSKSKNDIALPLLGKPKDEANKEKPKSRHEYCKVRSKISTKNNKFIRSLINTDPYETMKEL